MCAETLSHLQTSGSSPLGGSAKRPQFFVRGGVDRWRARECPPPVGEHFVNLWDALVAEWRQQAVLSGSSSFAGRKASVVLRFVKETQPPRPAAITAGAGLKLD